MINKEDKILIKNLWELKGYGARRLIREFFNKNWKRRGLEDSLRKLYKKLGCLIIVGLQEVADHVHRAAVTFLLFHFHKVAQVRYLDLGEVNMFFMCV